ncbi:Uncharacterized protein APZ42_032433 [Daphnia magna]|uniref:Uncharacterized protein n=1 Tax=Daphnia magna TaxID=35525 RepID=A0A162D9F8_9CRUS|nr:Uncharacterized protein APZ42_032433 [Daphnia magna]
MACLGGFQIANEAVPIDLWLCVTRNTERIYSTQFYSFLRPLKMPRVASSIQDNILCRSKPFRKNEVLTIGNTKRKLSYYFFQLFLSFLEQGSFGSSEFPSAQERNWTIVDNRQMAFGSQFRSRAYRPCPVFSTCATRTHMNASS